MVSGLENGRVRWVVLVEGAPKKKWRERTWRSEAVSFFEARRIAKRACLEREQVAQICKAEGRAADRQPVEIHYPDGRVERPRDGR